MKSLSKKNNVKLLAGFLTIKSFFFLSCVEVNNTNIENTPPLDKSRGECSQTLSFSNSFSLAKQGTNYVITANNIPSHKVGLFGSQAGALNPNAIRTQNSRYAIVSNPQKASDYTPLLSTQTGPAYSFGVLLNGVELDPVAAEPWPHDKTLGVMSSRINWEWNLEATNVQIGLDCNNAHVQPSGKYHYHGSPVLYLEAESISSTEMSLVGYAADGFPIYYKYAYSVANDINSTVKEMKSSYRLKSGNRGGDGINAPVGAHNGVYSNDYEYINGLGDLDQANGREGVTPEYPNGIYYYVITDDFPSIPRYFRGTPSTDFKLGGTP